MIQRSGLYDSFNEIAVLLVYIFNILNFKSKTKVIGRGTLFFTNSTNNKSGLSFSRGLLILGEIIIISYAQYQLSSINSIFGRLVGTEVNYFGKLFFAPILLAFFCLILGIDVFKQMDIITPAFPLALVASKFGCFCAGCCSGIECSFGLYNYQNKQTEFPSQLLEMALAAAIFIFLMIWKKKAKEGTMYPTYLIVYSATRFFSEFSRAEENVFFFLKRYHIICLVGIAAGILMLVIVKKLKERIRHFYNAFFDAVEDILNDIEIKLGIKRKDEIVHHKNKRKKPRKSGPNDEQKEKIFHMKRWIIIWTLGLIGQIGWTVEGTWFNTFVYEKIDKTPTILTPMMILSALATTVSIFVFGTLTDRTGKRRNLISSGFVLWGVVLICFGVTQYIAKANLALGVISILFLDMLLSFFGSMSSDVGYGTWLTDIMDDTNRGQIGAAIAVQVVLGSLLGNIIGGYIVGSQNNYLRLFIVTGSLLAVLGMVSVVLFNERDDVAPSVNGSYSKQLASVFNFRNVFKNKEFMWVNIAVALFFTGYHTYFPHLGNVLTQYYGYDATQMGIIEAIPMIFALVATVPVTNFINQKKYIGVVLFSIGIGLVGLLSAYTITPETLDISKTFNFKLYMAVFFVAVSYIIMLQTTKIWTKNLHPQETKGQYEGVWAISFALIPNILGSNISEWIIKNSSEALINVSSQRYEYIPNEKLFLVGAIISTLSFIPFIIAKKYSNKHLTENEKNKA